MHVHERQPDVVRRGHVFEEVMELEHHADLAPKRSQHVGSRRPACRQRHAADRQRAGVEGLEARDRAQERRLAAA